ncbi:probable carbohydrate esterase At4g34215 [Juglans microcarpa x Juglans regia]|uniref:probable carbohydrate esterase At4g34215 n=1 Tax=Juglans microcarpa x Juglans regia TaxID=2249226 RepID=UPI001B7EC37E|nr:probable carbohydrate esterase At4g34215 [Juglans microcarpa x Juglans regia]
MFLFVIFFVLVTHVGSIMPGELKPDNIFLLAGQSNMAGRGGVYNDTVTNLLKWDGLVPPQCTPTPKILTLSLNKTWEIAREPLHKEIDNLKTCGVGPGMPFSNQILAERPDFGVIGLVPCAIGGTKIEQWQKGTILYNQLMDRARAASQSGGRICALLWYQGESDCGEQDAMLYKGRLEKFFNDVRQDLNSPYLPINLVVISSGEGEFLTSVRDAQLNINLSNFNSVDSVGSSFIADHLHLDTRSAVRIGQKLADSFLYIISPRSN